LKLDAFWKSFLGHAEAINYLVINDFCPNPYLNANKIRIAVLASAGLGGTEKAATTYAVGLAKRGYLVDYLGDHGPRESYLIDHGVQAINVGTTPKELCAYIESAKPHIIHQHVPGYPFGNPLYPALAQLRHGSRKPKIIETNVFGRLEDPEATGLIDFRLFISMASAAQAFRRAGLQLNAEILRHQTVLYYPVSPPDNSVSKIDKLTRRSFRAELGVQENEIIAVRIGRPSHKWAAWECEAYATAKKIAPTLRLFLMEPPCNLMKKITSGRFGTGIIVRKETSNFTWLEKLYASADLMIHASDWGESFGYTIAEGMAAELPVITRSTPWCDNAQVELVKNRETGFVCWSIPEMGRRLIELCENAPLRSKIGAAAAQRILRLADVETEIDILEETIVLCLGEEASGKIAARNVRLLDFVDEFPTMERDTSEMFWGDHPADFAVGSLYALYRESRAGLRSILNRRQRGQMRKAQIP
jgi:glycosyltransferase involved in cell wall biosynthesis